MIKSDGGPSSYYDLPPSCVTLNDIIEWKGETQWLGDSFHLSNVTKAAWRWGIKDGTTKAYDARKLIYTGARLLMKYAGRQALRETLEQILDDKQFQTSEETLTRGASSLAENPPERTTNIRERPLSVRLYE